jgi:hypothetical protein
MNIRIKKIVWSLVLVIIFFASEAQAFSISPLKYESTIASGESQNFLVSVENNSDNEHSYQLVVTGARQDESGRLVFDKNIDIAENWVNFEKNEVSLKAREKKDFLFTISVPKNTPPGGHYLGMGIAEKNDRGVGGSLMTVVAFQVTGIANESLRLDNFYPVSKYFFDNNWRYFLQLKNVGNIDLAMSGSVQVLSLNNKDVFYKTVDLGSKLFSGSNRTVDFIISPEKNKIILPGKYQAVLTIHYGLTNQEIVSVVNFWYLPIWFMLSVLILIILVVSFFIFKKTKHEMV